MSNNKGAVGKYNPEKHGPATKGLSNGLPYMGKPPLAPTKDAASGHHRADGGAIPARARGGPVSKKLALNVGGKSSKFGRLDRRGSVARESGGRVGADSHPLSSAAKLTEPRG